METCVICDSSNVKEERLTEYFNYGGEHTDEALKKLKAIVPVLVCKDCNFSWTDYRAEEIRDRKVKYYLAHRCAVCKTNYVDSDNGYDTCDSCLTA